MSASQKNRSADGCCVVHVYFVRWTWFFNDFFEAVIIAMPPSPKKYELLAPVGSMPAFFAAIEAGADAVYCGLSEFSARAKARNFSLAEMDQLSAAAHNEGRRLYVALNTLIKEAEMPRLLEVLAGLAACRVDGLIIQDLGVWRLARGHFPELPLHASTQMTIHNVAGVKMLEQMGFSRGVLARELSLEEIAAIGRQSNIELEHFVHGALCFSVSGQCFFSSQLTGKSGNRGRCVQPCRRRYRYRGQPGFYFSTSDFCAIDMLPQLATAGVMSFKIEGRMKNAEYVAKVVAAYRLVLDASPAARNQALQEAHALLAQSYGRKPTTGFLQGVSADIVSPSRQGGIGQELGVIEKMGAGAVLLRVAATVHVGDRLRIQPENDLSGNSFTVQKLFLGARPVKRADAGSFVRIPTPFSGNFQSGDQVYKIATGKAFSLSEEACRRRLGRALHPPHMVELAARLEGNYLCLVAVASGCRFAQEYEVEMFAATRSPLTRETLQRTFEKTGHASLALADFRVGDLPPVVIPPSRLKEIRRDLYSNLANAVEKAGREQLAQRLAEAMETLLPSLGARPVPAMPCTVVVGAFPDPAIFADPGVGKVVVPLTPENVAAQAAQGNRVKEYAGRIVWDIPALIFEGDWPWVQTAITSLAGQGFAAFRLNNLAHWLLLDGRQGISPIAGPLLYVLNSQAALALAGLGAAAFSLSVEDDRRNMADILARDAGIVPLVTVYSPIPLLTSRIPVPIAQTGEQLESEDGEAIRLDFSRGITRAFAGQDFSLLGHVRELQALGCGEFVVDLSHLGADSSRGREILAALQEDRPLTGTTLFNFERGLV